MFLSNYQESASADDLPATFYVAAVVTWPGETGGQTNVLSARIAMEMDAASSGIRDNTNQEEGTVSAVGTSRVRFFEVYDAASSGNYLGYAIAGNNTVAPFLVDSTEVTANKVICPTLAASLVADDEVVFISLPGVSLPAGITEGTAYYVIGTPADSRIQVSATQGGSALDITGLGGGLVSKISYKDLSENDTLRINAGDFVSQFS